MTEFKNSGEQENQEEEKQFLGKFKSKLSGLSKKEQKLFIKLGLCLCLGILLMNLAGGKTSQMIPVSEAGEQSVSVMEKNNTDQLAAQLQQVLMQVKGAGQVDVMISYQSGAEKIYAYDIEQNSAEGSDNQKSSLAQAADGPVLLKEAEPVVQGVVVVAQGAHDPVVRERLYQAVSSLLPLTATRIAIIEGNGEL